MSAAEKNVGDPCECCKPTPTKPRKERLVLVNGALVCPECDSVHLWPSVRRGEPT